MRAPKNKPVRTNLGGPVHQRRLCRRYLRLLLGRPLGRRPARIPAPRAQHLAAHHALKMRPRPRQFRSARAPAGDQRCPHALQSARASTGVRVFALVEIRDQGGARVRETRGARELVHAMRLVGGGGGGSSG